MTVSELGKRAKSTQSFLSMATTDDKNKALRAIAISLIENQDKIIINHTAGLNMVYLNEKTDGNSVVRNYYEKHGVHYEPFDETDTN